MKLIRLLVLFLIVLLLTACNLTAALTPETSGSLTEPVEAIATEAPTATSAPVEAPTEAPVAETPAAEEVSAAEMIDRSNVDQLSMSGQMFTAYPQDITWSLDNQSFAVRSDNIINKFSVVGFESLAVYTLDNEWMIYDLSPDLRTLAYTGDMLTVQLYDLETQAITLNIEPYAPPYGAVFNSDGSRLLIASIDQWLGTEYATAAGEIENLFEGFETAAPVYAIYYSQDDQNVIWIARGSMMITNRATLENSPYFYHEDFIQSFALQPNGVHAVTSSAATIEDDFGPVLTIWNRETGEMVKQVPTGEQIAHGLVFSRDGSVLFGGVNNELCAWDASTFDTITCLAGHEEVINSVALSPDGRQILTSSADNSLILWTLNPR
ncbi:MAG: hypothetical protein JW750_07965 [Anaerolineaceae bacterium]|nr:hypothetical protein [Anaerolineaceae bacterium]